jgi:hypothetical protein
MYNICITNGDCIRTEIANIILLIVKAELLNIRKYVSLTYLLHAVIQLASAVSIIYMNISTLIIFDYVLENAS